MQQLQLDGLNKTVVKEEMKHVHAVLKYHHEPVITKCATFEYICQSDIGYS